MWWFCICFFLLFLLLNNEEKIPTTTFFNKHQQNIIQILTISCIQSYNSAIFHYFCLCSFLLYFYCSFFLLNIFLHLSDIFKQPRMGLVFQCLKDLLFFLCVVLVYSFHYIFLFTSVFFNRFYYETLTSLKNHDNSYKLFVRNFSRN